MLRGKSGPSRAAGAARPISIAGGAVWRYPRCGSGRGDSAAPAFPMKKTYVLDTNVLLHDPHAIRKFEDNDLILPIYVIEEIDQFKRDSNERGRNARTVTRLLDALRDNGGSLSKGVPIGDGGNLRLFVPEKRP